MGFARRRRRVSCRSDGGPRTGARAAIERAGPPRFGPPPSGGGALVLSAWPVSAEPDLQPLRRGGHLRARSDPWRLDDCETASQVWSVDAGRDEGPAAAGGFVARSGIAMGGDARHGCGSPPVGTRWERCAGTHRARVLLKVRGVRLERTCRLKRYWEGARRRLCRSPRAQTSFEEALSKSAIGEPGPEARQLPAQKKAAQMGGPFCCFLVRQVTATPFCRP